MPELTQLVQQFILRYRRALLLKAGLLLGLSLAIAGLLAWTLRAWRVAAVLSLGVPAGLAVLAAAGIGWWLRRRWIARQAAAAHLDRVLHLQERLTTAAEFAGAAQAPLLYTQLLEDARRQYAQRSVQMPNPVDRTAGALALALLLLLLIPRVYRAPGLPGQPPPVQLETDQPAPSQPDALGEEQDGEGAQGQGQRPQSGAASQGSQGGSNADQAGQRPSDASGTDRASGGQQPQQDAGSSSGRDPQQRGRQGGQGDEQDSSRQRAAADSEGQSGSQDQSGQDRREERRGSEGGAKDASGADGREQSRQSGGQQAAQPGKPGSESQPQREARGQRSPSGEQAAQPDGTTPSSMPQRGAPPPSDSRQPGSQGAASSEAQEALRGDIQKLLKEVSGELKDLQEQLSRASEQVKPEAGTSTDPGLYEAPMPEQIAEGGSSVPLQLETDRAETKQRRPGGGVGRASPEASAASPQTAPEEAQLADRPLEETPSGKQPVPPEYRSIFDRLRRRGQTPTPGAPHE